jgi:hypothetical protein
VASKPESKPLISLPMILVICLGIAIAGGIWVLERNPAGPSQPVLTPEAKAYVRNLKLSGVEMKAAESAVKLQLVEIVGNIGNAGDRPLKSVQIQCIFYDPYGQVVLKERVEIVRAKSGGLKPGETKSFRLPFDSLPGSWNQGLPQLVIAQIVFG